jgi:hypothetical protein
MLAQSHQNQSLSESPLNVTLLTFDAVGSSAHFGSAVTCRGRRKLSLADSPG